ncbi:hypothetical protein OF83DRAFT_1124615 [Amylostereum chailletii]|nr:hypothetical protein OF83DRAFT_1124615 [Amylostereum chailletii]
MDPEEVQSIIRSIREYRNPDWEAPLTTPRRACLPVELYRPIIEAIHTDPDIYQYTLRFLLYTSRAWRIEAERVIYAEVMIPENGLMAFACTIISRPDLGKMVRSLTFYRRLPHAPTPEDYERFDTLLCSLPNLKNLRVRWNPTDNGSIPRIAEDQNPKVFANRPFHLDHLMAFNRWNKETVELLLTQPEIREFEIALCEKPPPKPEDVPYSVLRKCNMLVTAPGIMESFVVPPPLRFLHVYLNDWGTLEERLGEAAEIGIVGDTLTSLAITRRYVRDGYLSMAAVVEGFAAQCPKLALLGLYDCVDFSKRDNAKIRRLLIDNFPNLRLFVWGPLASGLWENEDDGWSSEEQSGDSMCSDDDDQTTVKMERYATALMRGKPSLQFFVGFDGIGPPRHPRVWRRVGTGEDSTVEEVIIPLRSSDLVERAFRNLDPNDPEEYIYTARINPKRFCVGVPMYQPAPARPSDEKS